MLTRPYTLECTQQALVSGVYIYIYICLHFNFYSTGEWLNALSALKFEILELSELVYVLQLMRPGIS